jgi:hypothetical protein
VTNGLKGCRGGERREGGGVLARHHAAGGVGGRSRTASGGRPTLTRERRTWSTWAGAWHGFKTWEGKPLIGGATWHNASLNPVKWSIESNEFEFKLLNSFKIYFVQT